MSDEDRKWLGRGYEDVPGKPFGWAFNRESAAIRAHLIARGVEPRTLGFFHREQRLRQRLWRNRPTFKERQAAWLARQPAPGPSVSDQLADALRQIAAGHNDARALAAETLVKLGL